MKKNTENHRKTPKTTKNRVKNRIVINCMWIVNGVALPIKNSVLQYFCWPPIHITYSVHFFPLPFNHYSVYILWPYVHIFFVRPVGKLYRFRWLSGRGAAGFVALRREQDKDKTKKTYTHQPASLIASLSYSLSLGPQRKNTLFFFKNKKKRTEKQRDIHSGFLPRTHTHTSSRVYTPRKKNSRHERCSSAG